MARRPRKVELKPDDFHLGDDTELPHAVRRAVTVEIQKLPRGAFHRVKSRAAVQAGDRADSIAANANRGKGALVAADVRQERLALRRLREGRVDDGVVNETDYDAYLRRVTTEMYAAPDFERRVASAREFFSLFSMARLPGKLEMALDDYVRTRTAPGLLQLARAYIANRAAEQCPPGHLVRKLFRDAAPASLLPAETGIELLTVLSGPGLEYKHQVNLFDALPYCATLILGHLNSFEAANPGQDAPMNWMRPSDIGVFCHAMAGGVRNGQPRRSRQGGRKTTVDDIPALDRPELAPIAEQAYERLALLVSHMPTRRDRRRFRRTRLTAINAVRQAQIVHSESPEPVAPEPVPRRKLRKRAARQEQRERRQP